MDWLIFIDKIDQSSSEGESSELEQVHCSSQCFVPTFSAMGMQ